MEIPKVSSREISKGILIICPYNIMLNAISNFELLPYLLCSLILE